MFDPVSSLTDLMPGVLLKNQVINVLRTVMLLPLQFHVHLSFIQTLYCSHTGQYMHGTVQP